MISVHIYHIHIIKMHPSCQTLCLYPPLFKTAAPHEAVYFSRVAQIVSIHVRSNKRNIGCMAFGAP